MKWTSCLICGLIGVALIAAISACDNTSSLQNEPNVTKTSIAQLSKLRNSAEDLRRKKWEIAGIGSFTNLGVFTTIPDFHESPNLSLELDSSVALCVFADTQKRNLEKLKNGDVIIVRGTLDKNLNNSIIRTQMFDELNLPRFNFDVVLSGCYIVPPKTYIIDLSEMAEEFNSDAESAELKYQGQLIQVTITVNHQMAQDAASIQPSRLVLTANRFVLIASFDSNISIKAGQKITLKGYYGNYLKLIHCALVN